MKKDHLILFISVFIVTLFAPFRIWAEEVEKPNKVLSKSIGITGQYVWIIGSYGETIMNERITKEYSHGGIRAGIEGSLIWSFSRCLAIHARLSMTFDKLPRFTGATCANYADGPDCVGSFDEVVTFGITSSPVLAVSVTDWMWLEAQLGLFLGLSRGYEPDIAMFPAIGVGFDFAQIEDLSFYIRMNFGTDIPFSQPVILVPQITVGIRF